jgi:hypothetical protein
VLYARQLSKVTCLKVAQCTPDDERAIGTGGFKVQANLSIGLAQCPGESPIVTVRPLQQVLNAFIGRQRDVAIHEKIH